MTLNQHRSRRALGGVVVATVALAASLTDLPGTGTVPVAQAAPLQTIPLEAVGTGEVVLGELASRSQRKPVTIGGIGPFTITGTDSATNDPYTFVTDTNYSPSTSEAYGYESVQRAGNFLTTSSDAAASYDGRTGVTELLSNGSCAGPNNLDGFDTYCAVFGPEVYSEAFDATVGQSVSFDWAALRLEDDYEIYAYLVEVEETGTVGVYDYGTPASHTQLTYGRGQNQTWITASGDIPSDGSYRFRFVNGTYDGTGGFVVGSVMYIDGVVRVGTSNPIDFTQPGDTVFGSGDVNLTATAASPGEAVGFESITTDVCTVSGSTVSIVSVGICSIIADHPGDGVEYVPAASVTRSFQILAAATAPDNNGTPLIQGTVADGELATGTLGSWGDGGSPVTNIETEWQSNGVAIPGVSGDSCVLVADPSSTLTYIVTQTNSVGTTSASSADLVGYTCAAAAGPAWSDQSIGAAQVGVAFSDSVQATGSPTPTYAITDGALPDGLALDPETGAITGAPTAVGPYEFTVTATNAVGSISTVLTGTVTPMPEAPVFTDTTIGTLTAGTPFSDGVEASGEPAATYSVTAGSLPSGLVLDPATGAITGTPTVSGPYDFTVTATNVAGSVATQLTGTIEPAPVAPVFTDIAIGTLTVGAPFSDGVDASGSPAATYAVTAGVLPDGLILDLASGAITGTPTASGPYDFTVTATNVAGSVATQLTGTIAPMPGIPVEPTIVIVPPAVPGEEPAVVTGTGFEPGSTVEVVVGGVVTTATVDDSGTISVEVMPPALTDYVIDVTGADASGDDVELRRQVVSGFDGVGVVVPAASGYMALTPTRVLDTRPANGGNGKIEAGQIVRLAIDSEWNVPESATAVVLNVTAVAPEAVGYLTAYSCDDERPVASVVDYHSGRNAPNLAVVSTGETGEICIYTLQSTDIVVDLNGYFGEDVSDRLSPTAPQRLLDTRSGSVKVAAGEVVEVQVVGDGLAPSGSVAAVLNVTAVQANGVGFLTLFPCGEAMPTASNVNYERGQASSNHAIVKLSDAGTVCVFSFTKAHIVLDLNASFGPDATPQLLSSAPVRVLDTRADNGSGGGVKLDAGETIELDLGGDAGVAIATAFALNVTVAQPEDVGFITVFPCADGLPVASSVNFVRGDNVANHATAMPDEDGKVCFFASAATHMVVDVEGVYV